MDNELISQLYDSLILEHSRRPRNKKKLTCGCSQEGKNPSCGDQVTVYTEFKNNNIHDIGFEGTGCAICISSTSLMTQLLKDKSIEDAKKTVSSFIEFIIDEIELPEEYEPLHIYKTVHNFPSRVKCVLLSWRTMEFLLNNVNVSCNNTTISTEE